MDKKPDTDQHDGEVSQDCVGGLRVGNRDKTSVNNRIIHTLVLPLSLHILKSIRLTTGSDVGFTNTEPHHQA